MSHSEKKLRCVEVNKKTLVYTLFTPTVSSQLMEKVIIKDSTKITIISPLKLPITLNMKMMINNSLSEEMTICGSSLTVN